MDRKVLLQKKANIERSIEVYQKELESIEKELKRPVVLVVPLHRGNTNFVDNQQGLAYNVKVSNYNSIDCFWLQTADGTRGVNICINRKELEKIREAINIVLGD